MKAMAFQGDTSAISSPKHYWLPKNTKSDRRPLTQFVDPGCNIPCVSGIYLGRPLSLLIKRSIMTHRHCRAWQDGRTCNLSTAYEVGEDDVGLANKLQQNLIALRVTQIEPKAALVAVTGREGRRDRARHAALPAAVRQRGAFDLEDVGALIGEQPGLRHDLSAASGATVPAGGLPDDSDRIGPAAEHAGQGGRVGFGPQRTQKTTDVAFAPTTLVQFVACSPTASTSRSSTTARSPGRRSRPSDSAFVFSSPVVFVSRHDAASRSCRSVR